MLFSFTMTETDRISITPTIQAFLEKMQKFEKKNPEEAMFLRGELDIWALAVGAPGEARAETIANQIESSVGRIRKNGVQISIEEYLDGLFSLNPAGEISADIIMGRLQLG